jgi:hypothetical protein
MESDFHCTSQLMVLINPGTVRSLSWTGGTFSLQQALVPITIKGKIKPHFLK